MARRSDERYEGARRTVARFIGAADPLEVVFVRGTSEAINLVAATCGDANVRVGDEIVLTVAEHYSNLIPWQLLARRSGAVLRFVDVDDDGSVRLDELDGAVSQSAQATSRYGARLLDLVDDWHAIRASRSRTIASRTSCSNSPSP